jgi:hypothetical protein
VCIWFPAGWNLEPLHWQLGHFAQHIAMYVAGIVAHRCDWFAGSAGSQGRAWSWVALVLVPLSSDIGLAGGTLQRGLAPLMGGIHWQSLAYFVWEQLMCVAVVVSLSGSATD